MASKIKNPTDIQNYEERFDPLEYIHSRYKTPGSPENERSDTTLKFLHKEIQNYSSKLSHQDDIKVLDYGCGPVICNVISAADLPRVTEIVLAEYTAKNREMLTQWLGEEPNAFDWGPYLEYVVTNLEGKAASEVSAREKTIKSVSKVANCDIEADSIIEAGFEGPFDVIITLLTIQTSCPDYQNYQDRIQKLTALMKPGGIFLLTTPYDDSPGGPKPLSYCVGENRFKNIALSSEMVKNALMKVSIEIDSVVPMGKGNSEGDSANFIFISGKKRL